MSDLDVSLLKYKDVFKIKLSKYQTNTSKKLRKISKPMVEVVNIEPISIPSSITRDTSLDLLSLETPIIESIIVEVKPELEPNLDRLPRNIKILEIEEVKEEVDSNFPKRPLKSNVNSGILKSSIFRLTIGSMALILLVYFLISYFGSS